MFLHIFKTHINIYENEKLTGAVTIPHVTWVVPIAVVVLFSGSSERSSLKSPNPEAPFTGKRRE